MNGFNTKIGAGVLVGLSLVYMIASLWTGRSAKAEYPPDLKADESERGLGVWQAADMLVKNRGSTVLLDLRAKVDFERYHIPGALNEPGAEPARIAKIAQGKRVILVAAKDDDAERLAVSARAVSGAKDVFFLKGGAGAWYLALELPVPLFSDKDTPYGYEKAIAVVRGYFSVKATASATEVSQAIATLARLEYEPTLLGQSKKPKAAGQKRKKISGGCG